MLDAARQALVFAKGHVRADLDRNPMLMFALFKVIEIVGEAAYQMTEETRRDVPGIPWRDVIGMRHHLVHAYFDVNLDVLWDTATSSIPPLISVLEGAIERDAESTR